MIYLKIFLFFIVCVIFYIEYTDGNKYISKDENIDLFEIIKISRNERDSCFVFEVFSKKAGWNKIQTDIKEISDKKYLKVGKKIKLKYQIKSNKYDREIYFFSHLILKNNQKKDIFLKFERK